MALPDENDPIADDEILYRRIPASQGWYDPAVDPHPSPEAFRPNANDTSGLSIYRARFKTLEEVARGRAGKDYFVAVLRAGDLRAQGIEVVPRPVDGDPGHAEIPDLNYPNRKTDQSLERKVLLAENLCLRVEGPFTSTGEPEE